MQTKTVARRAKGRVVTPYGDKPRKRTKEIALPTLPGTVDFPGYNFKLLPSDDPRRIEIERTLARCPEATHKRPCTVIGQR